MTRVRDGYDVAMVGSGTAGSFAAIAAARAGARTLLIEKHGSVGGVLGLGMSLLGPVDGEGYWALGGIGREALERARELGGSNGPRRRPRVSSAWAQDPEVLKLVLLQMMVESGVELLLHTMLVDAPASDGRVTRLVVANKGGIEHVESATVVDCSGDADVVARAGGECIYGREGDGLAQPASRLVKLGGVDLDRMWDHVEAHPEDRMGARPRDGSEPQPYPMAALRAPGGGFEGFRATIERAKAAGDFDLPRSAMIVYTFPGHAEIGINVTRVHDVDGSDPDSLSDAEVTSQLQLLTVLRFVRKYIPGFEHAYISSSPFQIGIRETRHIRGAYTLDRDDVLSGASFPDQIGRCAYPFTLHDVGAGAVQDGAKVGGGGITFHAVERSFGIPLRCLVPVDLVNVAVGGRCISADHEASSSVRGQAGCMVTGQAAGTVAAIGAARNLPLAEVDAAEVQQALLEQGAILERSEAFDAEAAPLSAGPAR